MISRGGAAAASARITFLGITHIAVPNACFLIEHNVEMPIEIERVFNAKPPDNTLVPIPDDIKNDAKDQEQKHIGSFSKFCGILKESRLTQSMPNLPR